jgi:Zn-finger nucleic acid-binding protein
MRCPNCEETLVMTERQGVEIDYCPKCRGVWLDRGELDKIIDKSAAGETRIPDQSRDTYYDKKDRPDYYDKSDSRYYDKHDPRYRHKKKGFLGDLFDFD